MNTPTKRILVAGGGIAGAVACLRLRQQGHTPIWITPRVAPGDRPGEHLAPAARPLLAEIEALHLLDRPYHREAASLYSAWGSAQLAERNALLLLEGPGSVVDRARFEADLVDLAKQRGLQPRTAKITAVEPVGEQWRISLSEARETADYLVDATGRRALIARRHANRYRADQLTAAVGFYRQRPGCEVEATRTTLIEAVSDGWWYAALLPDGRLALNHYTDPDSLPDALRTDLAAWERLIGATRHIRRWIDEAGFVIDRPPRLHSAATTWLAPCAGRRWLAVGDSAAAFDPLSSHGMTTALWTGITGADVALAATTGGMEPSHRFVERVALGVQQFLRSRRQIYGIEQRFADRPFWQRRQRSES